MLTESCINLCVCLPFGPSCSVALQHPSLWVALVDGGTVAQILDWAAAHLQASLCALQHSA